MISPRRFALLLALTSSACARSIPSVPDLSRVTYDVIIENGRLVDGTGNPWTYGDVGIHGDRIVAITRSCALRLAVTRQRVDARGSIVTPGFIDIQAIPGKRLGSAPVARRARREQGHTGKLFDNLNGDGRGARPS